MFLGKGGQQLGPPIFARSKSHSGKPRVILGYSVLSHLLRCSDPSSPNGTAVAFLGVRQSKSLCPWLSHSTPEPCARYDHLNLVLIRCRHTGLSVPVQVRTGLPLALRADSMKLFFLVILRLKIPLYAVRLAQCDTSTHQWSTVMCFKCTNEYSISFFPLVSPK